MTESAPVHSTELGTIDQRLRDCGVSRRSFLQFCSSLMIAAPFGLAITDMLTPEAVAASLRQVIRPPVIWLAFQDCTGCTTATLQSSHPDFADLILNVISLEYHETLMAASGTQARQVLDEAVLKYAGKYILVVEGSIPTRDKGIYMKLAGRPALDVLADIGGKAAAIVAIGSCASWGGIPSADPDPTGAVGVVDLLPDKSIVNIPGCPPNPYTLLGVLLQFASNASFPELDDLRRPKFAFDRDIHEHCPRRAHFDAGHFVKQFGDEGHREGWCLYEMGCKGPDTHAGCSTRHFNDIPDVWPIGIGAPCIGCTEKSIAFKVPMFQVVQIHTAATPPATYAPIFSPQGIVSPLATGLVGLAAGALAGAGYVASRKFSNVRNDDSVPGNKSSQDAQDNHHKPDPGPHQAPPESITNDKGPSESPGSGPEASV